MVPYNGPKRDSIHQGIRDHFQQNVKLTLYLQATMAGFQSVLNQKKIQNLKERAI